MDPRKIVMAGVRLLEATGTGDKAGWKWRVRVIKAGLSRNGNEYPEDTLRAAVPLFEGVRALARSDEDHVRDVGKRVQDIVGWFSNAAYVNGGIEADFTIHEGAEWLRTMMASAWDHGKKDLVGFSIVADAKAALKRTAQRVTRHVGEIVNVRSVDVIVNPSAGGEVVSIVAGMDPANDQGMVEIMDVQRLFKLLESVDPAKAKTLDKENLPDADTLEGYITEANAKLTAANAKLTEAANGNGGAGGTDAGTEGNGAATVMTAEAITEAVKAATAPIMAEADKRINTAETRQRFTGAFVESELPAACRDRILDALLAKSEDGVVTEAAMGDAFKAEREYLAAANPVFAGVGSAFGGLTVEAAEPDKVKAAFLGLFMQEPQRLDPADPKSEIIQPMRSIREAYLRITGDHSFSGTPNRTHGMKFSEALDTGDWTEVLGDSIARRMQKEYNTAPYSQWRNIADVAPVGDFREQKRGMLGGFSDLVSVAEGVDYADFTTSPSDDEATYSITKFGRTAEITMEMVVNDDVGAVRRIPVKIGRAAARTLNTQVWTPVTSNAAIYDSVVLFHAGSHANTTTSALSQSTLIAGRTAMMKQTEADSGERLNIGPRFLCVPVDLEETASDLCYASGKAILAMTDTNPALGTASTGTAENPGIQNFISRNGIVPLVIPHATDTNNWYLAADKADIPTMEVGFFQGREEPELFVQDMPNVGSMFTADKILYKVRLIFGKAILDYRGWYGGIVA